MLEAVEWVDWRNRLGNCASWAGRLPSVRESTRPVTDQYGGERDGEGLQSGIRA